MNRFFSGSNRFLVKDNIENFKIPAISKPISTIKNATKTVSAELKPALEAKDFPSIPTIYPKKPYDNTRPTLNEIAGMILPNLDFGLRTCDFGLTVPIVDINNAPEVAIQVEVEATRPSTKTAQ
jgi:hypothetical protein